MRVFEWAEIIMRHDDRCAEFKFVKFNSEFHPSPLPDPQNTRKWKSGRAVTVTRIILNKNYIW